MKRFILTFLCLSFIFGSIAQEKDTTHLVFGKSKILIIKDKSSKQQFKELKKRKMELEMDIEALNDSVKKYSNENDTITNSNTTKFQNAIQQSENEIAQINSNMAEINNGYYDGGRRNGREKRNSRKEKRKSKHLTAENTCEENNSCCFGNCSSRRGFDPHWAGFEWGFTALVDKNFSFTLGDDAKFLELNSNYSWDLSLNLIETDISFDGNLTGVYTGLGINWTIMDLSNKYRIDEDENGNIIGVENTKEFDDNSLQTFYLNVPIMFEVQIPFRHSYKRAFFAAGVIGGAKIYSFTKEEIDDDANKDEGDFNLTPFRLISSVRFGVGGLRLFVNYNLTSLFKEDKGSEVYPFTIGLQVLNF